jgi:hypothetical protein
VTGLFPSVRSAIVFAAAVATIAGMGCGDLLQEPESGNTPLPVQIEEVSGNDQEASPGAPLPEPVRVRVLDREGEPSPRLWVQWTVTGGSGEVRPRNTFSDESGIAETTWILGPEAGPQQVRVLVRGGTPVVFDATAVTP